MSQRLSPSSTRAPLLPEPERLAHTPQLGPLLERANREYKSGLDEHVAFQRLSARLEPRPSWLGAWPRATLGVALGLAAGVGLVWAAFGERAPGIAFGPEVTAAKAHTSVPAAPESEATQSSSRQAPASSAAMGSLETSPLRGENPPAQLADGVKELEAQGPPPTASPSQRRQSLTPSQPTSAIPATPAPSKPRSRGVMPPSSAEAASTRAKSLASSSLSAAPGAQNAARVSCLDFARKGDPHAAELCFNRQAVGSGLTAEMALYELARLRRDVLRDPNGALDALDEYRRRFPQGTLRNEVSISRVELLSQLGRGREALRESQALLESASGRERAAELHVLRGNVFRSDLADLAAAVLEYAQAEPFGGSLGSEASRLRGMSLETLGDVNGALAAYRRYLSGPEQPRRTDVLRRVDALTQPAQPRPAHP